MFIFPLILAAKATLTADSQAFLTRPDIHGNQVVFTAEGDLWLADLETGDARRLTSDPGVETNARFSPDGTQLAFNANYEGGSEVYAMPVTGGIPKRLTYDSARTGTIGWTPDGENVIFRSGSKQYTSYVAQFSTQELFEVPIAGGMPRKLPVPKGSFASLNGDGHTLAYVPTSNEWMNWYRYEAGEADKIWTADLKTGKFTQLTNSKGVDTQPVWLGNMIYFVSERSGIRNLWMLDPASKKVKQITFSKDLPVRFPASDGKRIVFELGPRLAVYDPATNETKVIPVDLHSDHVHARPFEASIARPDGGSLGPTGKRVALVARGHLVTVPAGEGSMRTLINDSSQRVLSAVYAPDGKRIAYVSDATGEEQIHLIDTADDAAGKALTKDLAGQNSAPTWSPDGKWMLIGNRTGDIKLVDATTGVVKIIAHSLGFLEYDQIQTDFSFSPDSKWVAYSVSPGSVNGVVSIFEIATGKSTTLTASDINSSSPAWSPDGKYLYMLQDRSIAQGSQGISFRTKYDYQTKVTAFALASDTGTPFAPKEDEEAEAVKKEAAAPPPPAAAPGAAKPPAAPAKDPKDTKIDLAGLQDRYFDMKVPAGSYQGIVAVPGKILIQTPGALMAYDPTSKALTPLAPGVRLMDVSHDLKKLLVAGPAGLQVIDAGGPGAPGAGALKLAGLTVTIDPAAEWKQIFYEAWRVGRDFFYDPNTHGVNWMAIKKKYEAELPLVASRDDLTRLIGDMISEFNTGHCYTSGPPAFTGRPGRPGLLGVDLAWDGTGYKITHMLKGDAWNPDARSPLAEPGLGVHEGDYIVKIRGTKLVKDKDPMSLLVGMAGQTVSIAVNSKPTTEGAKTIPVTPIGSDMDLRQRDWVNSRRAYVEKASNGQIGYVYVGDMTQRGGVEFAQSYYPNVDKPGIIVDVRGNGGGNISGNLLSDLSGKVTGYFAFRAGGNFRRENWAPLGQVVAVTDEWAFSDGEYFSEFFKRLKIGPLVGHRTGGGEVGSGGGYAFVDGGTVHIPNYGAYIPGQWVIEGKGAVPDYEVDQDPAAVMAGKDPQLDKAISLIMDNLKNHPFKAVEHPPFPVKLGGSQG